MDDIFDLEDVLGKRIMARLQTQRGKPDSLASRSLFRKRSLALREFSLGIEALERFIHREPLRRVHECVFGILALESEPVDPRL